MIDTLTLNAADVTAAELSALRQVASDLGPDSHLGAFLISMIDALATGTDLVFLMGDLPDGFVDAIAEASGAFED